MDIELNEAGERIPNSPRNEGTEENREMRDNRLDELVDPKANQFCSVNGTSVTKNKVIHTRRINLILDHSAFIYGIGNIKRWFNREHIQNNSKGNTSENLDVCIYIPSYTLHEFDFAKKGVTMMATNAYEAIRLIDKLVEQDVHVVGEDINKGTTTCFRIDIERPNDATPSWSKCLKFKLHSPKIREFPNYKTMFDSNRLGARIVESNRMDIFNHLGESSFDMQKTRTLHGFPSNEIQYENSPSYQMALANSENEAEMPTRLRYLISLCIYKRFMEKNDWSHSLEEWKVVTEDPITRIWSRCFGLECLNVNDAELLIFQNFDVSSHSTYNPHDYHSEEYDPRVTSRDTIDTTLYSYVSLNAPSAKTGSLTRKRQGRYKAAASLKELYGVVYHNSVGTNGDFVKKERFDAINFAPRGQGKLWQQPKKQN